jgi:oligosaccharyltransferase complex subunit epsilon
MKGKQDAALIVQMTQRYLQSTTTLMKALDTFLVFVMLTGITQFVYMLIVGTYPYNAFLSGFATSVGMFCNTANLRIQLHPQNTIDISPERAYADFAFSSFVLFVFAICFVG